MIVTAVLLATSLDVNFDQFVAAAHPQRQPHRVARVLAHGDRTPARDHRPPREVRAGQRVLRLRRPRLGAAAHGRRAQRQPGDAAGRRAPAARTSARRPNSPTPSTGSTRPAASPLTLASLRGRVVLVDFWTYTCINCIRTLPYLKAWDAAYRNDGLTIVGVETPEFAFEHDACNVAERDPAVRDPLPGRPGQRNGHLERLRQRVLARRLPDRRQRPGALRGLRRGRLRQDRNRDPRAAAPKPARSVGAPQPRQRRDRALQRRPRPRPTSAPPARKAGCTGPNAGLHDYGAAPTADTAAERVRLQRHLEDRRAARRSGRRTRASTSSSRPRTSTSC